MEENQGEPHFFFILSSHKVRLGHHIILEMVLLLLMLLCLTMGNPMGPTEGEGSMERLRKELKIPNMA